MEIIEVNGESCEVVKLLGKGKGGYSYLVRLGGEQLVLKQIHHEPCEYYTFGDKLESELRDYRTLERLGVPMPRLIAADRENERILKQYIDGPTVLQLADRGFAAGILYPADKAAL